MIARRAATLTRTVARPNAPAEPTGFERVRLYADAAGMTLVAIAVCTIWSSSIGASAPLVLCLAVIFSAWWGGLGPGLLATAVASLWTAYALIDPPFSLRIGPEDILQAGVFTVLATLVGTLAAGRRRAERQLTETLAQKDMMLQEMAHRMKNNLQALHHLASLQAESVDDPTLVAFCRDSQNRIKSMALTHQLLEFSRGQSSVHAFEFLSRLAEQLRRSYGVEERVSLTVHVEPMRLSLEHAIPCGLLVNELLSNALKHAFPRGRSGSVEIRLTHDRAGGCFTLCVSDDGVGMPASVDAGRSPSLGLRLVQALADQLAGTVTYGREAGTSISVKFPERPSGSVVPAAGRSSKSARSAKREPAEGGRRGFPTGLRTA